VAQFCSLRFDDVEPSAQMGLTLRMLAIARGLEDNLTFWCDGVELDARSHQLLCLDDGSMQAIRMTSAKATCLCEQRRFREAFVELCGARRYLEPKLLGRGDLPPLRRTSSHEHRSPVPHKADGLSLERSQTEPMKCCDDDSTDAGDSSATSDVEPAETMTWPKTPPGSFAVPGCWILVVPWYPTFCHNCYALCNVPLKETTCLDGFVCPHCFEEVFSASTMQFLCARETVN